MPSRTYFVYLFDGQRHLDSQRHGGGSIPEHLIAGHSWHFLRMCEVSTDPEMVARNKVLLAAEDKTGASLWSFYGGAIVNFDQQSLVICSDCWGSQNTLWSIHIDDFTQHSHLRWNMMWVLQSHWPDWKIEWTTLEDFNCFLVGGVSYQDLPRLDDDAPDTPEMLMIPGEILQAHYRYHLEQIYREGWREFRTILKYNPVGSWENHEATKKGVLPRHNIFPLTMENTCTYAMRMSAL